MTLLIETVMCMICVNVLLYCDTYLFRICVQQSTGRRCNPQKPPSSLAETHRQREIVWRPAGATRNGKCNLAPVLQYPGRSPIFRFFEL